MPSPERRAPPRCRGCNAPFRLYRPGDRVCRSCRGRFAAHDPELWLAWPALLRISVGAPLGLAGLLGGLMLLAGFPHWLIVTFDLGPLWFIMYLGVFAVGARIGLAMERLGLR